MSTILEWLVTRTQKVNKIEKVKSKVKSRGFLSGAILGFQKMREGRGLGLKSVRLEPRVSILGKNRWKIVVESSVGENGGVDELKMSTW